MPEEASWEEVLEAAGQPPKETRVTLSDDEARALILEAIAEHVAEERAAQAPVTPAARRKLRPMDVLRMFQGGLLRRAVEKEAGGPELVDPTARRRRRSKRRGRAHQSRVAEYSRDLGIDPARPVTPVPPVPEGKVVVESSEIVPGRVIGRILRDERTGTHSYEIVEPPLTAVEEEALEFIRDTAVRLLEPKPDAERPALEQFLRQWVEDIIIDYSVLVDDVAKERVLHHIVRDYLGFGKIDAIMRDPMIEDVSVDGPGIPVYVFHREYQSLRTNVVFQDDKELDAFIIRLAQVCGKSISTADPLLDATLPDGSRLQATLAREVTTRGSSLTVRKVLGDPLTTMDLVRRGTMSAEMASLLWMALETGQSLILAGGTASGKTTTLNALALFIPPAKKIVTIEDTREITLLHENWIAGLTRKAFGGEQMKEISMYRLLEAALRQRPEYLVVGEVRGPEAMTLFQAMATGHATYSTMHADSFRAAVNRLENPPLSVPRVMLQNLNALAVQVQVQSGGRMARRMKELVEVSGFDGASQEILTNVAFRWNARTDRHVFQGRSVMLERYAAYRNLTAEEAAAEWERRTRVIRWMTDLGLRRARDVWAVIAAYYSNRDAVLARLEAHPASRAEAP